MSRFAPYPADGIAAFTFLIERLQDDAADIVDPVATQKELEAIVRRLREAQSVGSSFCLHLRMDTAYSGAEFANRQGSY